MTSKSRIEWTEVTWNPVTGCSKVSNGCKNCYAERMSKRLKAMRSTRYSNGFQVTLHHDLVERPLKWKKPRMVFVNSMSDLFHESIPDDFILSVFSTMANAPQHIFQVLTKRSSRLIELSSKLSWSANIWMGVSVEDPDNTHRAKNLQNIPAQVRFLSCEPLLGAIPSLPLIGIHWVIVGGESGPGARPIAKEWVESILRQCGNAGVPFFFKQWGGTQKHLNGRKLHNRTYDEFPVSALNHPASLSLVHSLSSH